MKRFLLSLAMVAVVSMSYSQNLTDVSKQKDYYHKKSQHQFLISGALFTGGVLLTIVGFSKFTFTDAEADKKGYPYLFTGLALEAASIPVFVSAVHNRKRAASLSLKVHQVPSLNAWNLKASAQPAFTFTVPFK